MSITGIDQVTFGVEDLEAARRFFADFGLTEQALEGGASFTTVDGGEVRVRPASATDLPPAFEPGSTLREVIWGCADKQALADTVASLRGIATLDVGADGVARCTDPNGLRLGFRMSERKPVVVESTPVNAPGTPRRINQESFVRDDGVRPINIGHVVLFVSSLEENAAFYQSRLRFVVSDRYPNAGLFLRCQPTGGHHNLFLLQRPGKQGLNHVAFTVRDLHEVIAGGLAMSRKGWQTDIGPGRHPISSAMFWYFKSPCGGSAEYYADEDYLTAEWQPRDFVRAPENFIEWAFAGGIDLATRRQKTA